MLRRKNQDVTNYYAIDIAKFISALLVVCIHTGPLLDISKEANFVLVQIIARIAVPLFFMISGFLFFRKIDLCREWNDYENISALKHYLIRLAKIYIIWSIIYLPITYLLLQNGDGITVHAVLRYIRDFFFLGSHYHLWFLPSLMFAIVICYFMVFHLSFVTGLLLACILYIIGMFGNIYGSFLMGIPFISTLYQAYMAVFETTRNGLFFGVLFVFIGAIFAYKHVYMSTNKRLFYFIISFVLLIGEVMLIHSEDPLISMYAMLAPCVSFLFLFLIQIRLEERSCYKALRVMSLLIYTSHIYFIQIVMKLAGSMNSLIMYGCVILLSCIFSYMIYVGSKKIPLLKGLY